MDARDVLDHDVVERLRQLTPPGEPDVLNEVLSLFLNEVPRKIDALRTAVTAGDRAAMQRTAHSLKGSSGNIGAHAMYDACRQLDDQAKSGDLARLKPLIDAVATAYRNVEIEIRRMLQAS